VTQAHGRLAADQGPRSRPCEARRYSSLTKYSRLKRTRPAPWDAGRVASTRSRSDSEAPEPGLRQRRSSRGVKVGLRTRSFSLKRDRITGAQF
jgi:hypothetical protein